MDSIVLRLTQRGSPFEIMETTVRGVPCKVFPKGPQSLIDIYRKANLSSNREFLVAGTSRMSVGDALSRAARLAAALQRDFRVKPGTQVAIYMENSPDWVAALIAVTSLGAIVVALPTDLAPETMEQLWHNSDIEVAICGNAQASAVFQLLHNQFVIVGHSSGHPSSEPDSISLTQLVDETIDPPRELRNFSNVVSSDTTAMIAFTSGSTGAPKGVMLSHRNLTTGLMNMMLGRALQSGRAAAEGPRAIATFGVPSVLMLAPLSYIAGYAQILLMLYIGGKVVFLSDWQLSQALCLIEEEGIRGIAGATPSMLRELIRETRVGPDVSCLSSFHLHGAAPHALLINELMHTFPAATVSTGYGLTETCGSICSLAGAELANRPASSGMILPSVDLKLTDVHGTEVPFGQIGEISVRGAMVMQGYWDAPDETPSVLQDGWFKTGDLGQFDAEGYLYVLDRDKDTLVYRGLRYSSTAIERAAMSIPFVEEVAVVGILTTAGFEELGVAVVVQDCADVGGSLHEHFAKQLRQHILAPAIPLKLFLIDTFPRTRSGKIDRFVLRRQILGAA